MISPKKRAGVGCPEIYNQHPAPDTRYPAPDTRHPAPDTRGNGRGIFGQIKDRLGNAAKVRDIKEELARRLGVESKVIRAQFHNIEHHRAHICEKLDLHGFNALVKYAISHKSELS